MSNNPPSAYDKTFENYNIPLYVPESSIKTYQNTNPWSKFLNIKAISEETAIELVKEGKGIVQNVYKLNGQTLNKIQKGLNIIRMSNGKTKKVIAK